MENQNLKDTALLVMDVQRATIAMISNGEDYLKILTQTINKARAKNIPIIYIVIGFRKGYPEVNPLSRTFSRIKSTPALKFDTEEALKVHPSVAPLDSNITVVKKRVSAFAGSDLEILLRSMGIQHIVLAGIATSGVVLSTLREAADKDYRITVLSDCCADLDEEVHRVLTAKVFVRQADVLTSSEWL